MRGAAADERPAGQITLMIQQQVQLHRGFGALVVRPIKHLQAQIEGGGVQGIQRVFEAELPALLLRRRQHLVNSLLKKPEWAPRTRRRGRDRVKMADFRPISPVRLCESRIKNEKKTDHLFY